MVRIRAFSVFFVSCVLASLIGAAAAVAKEKPKSELGALEFRSLGPAITGRATRVAGVPGDPLTYYVAFAQGGIWKSETGGRTWTPVFDDEPTNSIGSLAIAPSDPNVIYAGTGEANIRGNVSWGTGIFKSTDAGKNWQQVWKTRGQIGTMAVDPRNPDIAFAAVLGSPFGPNKDRGVYRTTDGGKTWKQVLYKDDQTGASDVALDPNNPRIVFAGMWQALRQPWVMTSGGPGSGLYRSDDGGDTWEQVKEHGLPGGIWGKVGVRVAPSNSNVVYALIEAKDGGLYRSDDGGEKWVLASDHHSLRQRAWYYTCLTIDPTNADIVWFPQVPLLKTEDGGRTIVSVDAKIHGDHHDIWIDPTNPRRIMSGNDGGVGISTDGGATWMWPAMPTPQFYNIDVDDRWPYRVGGTIQDWGTASGPAFTLRRGEDGDSGSGPGLGDFWSVGGGEAGDFVYDRATPGTIYAGEYGGYISRYQEGVGNFRSVGIYPHDTSGMPASELKYRFQWTAPIATSPHDPKVLYHGANLLFRTTDGGATWQAISPDLTRNDKSKQQWSGGPITGDITGVETYDTIFSIAESPVTAGLIWVGTDDGLVQLTQDGGKSWTNVTPKKLPEWGTIEAIEPSRRDAGTAYVVVDARRLNDPRPYLFRTRDHGKSWDQLGKGLPDDQHLFVVREDPTNPDLLYVGAERGLYMSRDGGGSFFDIHNNLPAVGVADIEVKHDDLILGTRRGIWILDDITALRAFDPAIKSESVHLFAPRNAYRARLEYRWDSLIDKVSSNRPYGMNITYWLKDEPAKTAEGKKPSPDDPEELKLEIYDAQGTLVRTLSSVPKPDRFRRDDPDEPKKPNKPALTKKQGLNRVQWDLRHEGATRPPDAKVDAGDPEEGPLVPPGKYTLKLTAAGRTLTTVGEVLADPRSSATIDDMRANYGFALQAGAALDRLERDIEAVRAVRGQAATIRKLTATSSAAKDVAASADAVVKRCDAIERRMHNPDAQVVYDVLAGRHGGAQLYSQLSSLYSSIQDSDYAPTQGQDDQLREDLGALAAVESELAGIRTGELARLEAQANAVGLPHVIVPGGG